MIKTLFDKGTWIGRTTLLPGVIRRQMCKGHPGPAPTAARGMPIGRDHRRSARIPHLRRLILLSVISVLASLAVTAPASAASFFSNPTPIAIPGSGDIGNASPYPSEIAVSGLTGPITSVAVTLHRFGHGVPSNADILLVSPSGDTVIVMSDACNPATEIEDFTWTFSQQAAGPMTAPCGESVYQPTNNAGADNFPGAPAGPHGTSFNDFNNENPNGTWKLYVVDDFDEGITGVDDIGDIEVGWTLAIETGPVDVAIPASGTSGPASPYPATRTVSGVAGGITDVNVTIDGIWHERPDDLDLLLVGPHGQKVILMSDACGSLGVSGFGWQWDDEAAAPMPEGNGTNVCGTRFHRPANYGSGDVWPAPAPTGPYSTSLSAFDLTDPNGEWSLFVNDDAAGNTGFFTNRFQLQITTDTTAPNTVIDSGPRKRTAKRTATFTFSSTEPGSTFECKRDNQSWIACISPRKLRGLSRGVHEFRVRATDAAGNVDGSPATRRWRVV